MKIIIVKDTFEGGKVGFKHLEKTMQKGQIHVLGLATGSTPITFYDEIVKSNLDFQQLISINLDEYCGLAADHEQSYHTFMKKHLFNQKPFKINYLPNGLETDAEKECQRYDQIVVDNPIDLQILGIGENGHIGFNEPGTAFDSTTHKVSLTESTIAANARFFASEAEVPHYAYSMGIQSIMSAKEIVLFAYGEHKKEAIRRLVEEPETLDLPASALKSHPNVTLILDEAAASALTHS